MQSKPKRNSVVTTQRLETGVIRLTVLGAGSLDIDKGRFPEELRDQFEDHGIVQRYSDRAAMSRDEATGKPATPGEKFARIKAYHEHLLAGGTWHMGAAGRGGVSIVILAVQRVMGLADSDMAEAHMARYGAAHPEVKDVKAFYGAMPKVQRAILDIQRERLADPILDADAEADALSAE